MVEHVHWTKDGVAVPMGNTTSMHGNMLTFTSVNEEDNGRYQCTASNAVSNTTSPAFILHVVCEWHAKKKKRHSLALNILRQCIVCFAELV